MYVKAMNRIGTGSFPMYKFIKFLSFQFQNQRPISMKKENIQSRNRKLSAKSRKKHNSFTADMLKPFEKMYAGYGMAGAAAAGMGPMSSAAAMTSAGMGKKNQSHFEILN